MTEYGLSAMSKHAITSDCPSAPSRPVSSELRKISRACIGEFLGCSDDSDPALRDHRITRSPVSGVNRMIIEMRTYKTKPGLRSKFLEIFRTKSMPAHAEIGMKILGPFLSVEDPDTFFFMRGFPDLASREPMKAKFYEGTLWKSELESLLMPMLDKYEVVLVEDPEGMIQW